MSRMFSYAISFNGDISKWDVSRVTDMCRMFFNAKSFNGDLSKWDVSSVKNMDSMFYYAVSFKQKMCGAAWVHSQASKKFMFEATSGGSISSIVCTSAPSPATTQLTRRDETRRPLPERELVARTRITTAVSVSASNPTILITMACPKCGMFAKSGRVSCCAPGGAWYKNCGGAANKNVDHRWFEGTEACKRKFEDYNM